MTTTVSLQASSTTNHRRKLQQQRRRTRTTTTTSNSYAEPDNFRLPKAIKDMLDHELLTKQQDLEYGRRIQEARLVQEEVDEYYAVWQQQDEEEQRQRQRERMLEDDDDDDDNFIDYESLYAPPPPPPPPAGSLSSSYSNHNNNDYDGNDWEEDLHNLSVYSSTASIERDMEEEEEEDNDEEEEELLSSLFRHLEEDDEDYGNQDTLEFQQRQHSDNRMWLQQKQRHRHKIVGAAAAGSSSSSSSGSINFWTSLDRLNELLQRRRRDDDDDDDDVVQQLPLFSDEKNKDPAELKRILVRGAMAKNELIRCNVKLVVSIAQKWNGVTSPTATVRPTLSEYVQEGLIGLALAADRYDATKQLRFSTYATYYITNEIRGCMRRATALEVPQYYHDIAMKFRSFVREEREERRVVGGGGGGGSSLETTTTRWNEKEIAARLGLSPKSLQRALKYTQPLLSLDAPIYGGATNTRAGTAGAEPDNDAGGSTYLDNCICDDPSLQPETVLERSLLRQCLEDAMATELVPHERDVLRLRLGLDDGIPRTYPKVASILGTKTYQVKATEQRAFEKLTSTPLYTPILLSFLPERVDDLNSNVHQRVSLALEAAELMGNRRGNKQTKQNKQQQQVE